MEIFQKFSNYRPSGPRMLFRILGLNLETAVGRARWCVWARVCREARRQQAHACNDERQRQARGRTCQRVRSGVTHGVNVIEGMKLSMHAAFVDVMSGQLRFLG
jgi:hypothetical protein